jgi:hypothetical protein
MVKNKFKIGDVFEIELPNKKFAYGRVYKDASVGIYNKVTDAPGMPPVGLRDFMFIVGMYSYILEKGVFPIVAHDPFLTEDEAWPPPACIKDPIGKDFNVYYMGLIKKSTKEDCEKLESAAVWDESHIIDRIIKTNAKYYG